MEPRRGAAVPRSAKPRDPASQAWLAVAILVPLILGLVSVMGAIDLAYHLRAGNAIVSEGSIPRIDSYTFSVQGTAWVDQQWGAQVLLSIAFRAGGWPTLLALQAVLGAASFGFVLLAARARGATPRLAAVVTLLGFLLAYPMITLRPQLIALPLFGVALWIVAGRAAHPRRLWFLPVIALVIANLHGSFTLVPVLAALVWFDDVLARREGAWRSFVLIGATAAATLVNPFGIGAWAYALDLSTDPTIRRSITEWTPVSIGSTLGAATLVSVGAITASFARRREPIPWIDLITLAVFLTLALAASRAVLWWAMVAPVVLAGSLGLPTARGTDDGEAQRSARGPAVLLVGSLLVVVVALLPWWRGGDFRHHLEAAPPGITDALIGAPPGARIFAYQPWGSWFEYALPDKLVFVDSRIEIIPSVIWDDYFDVAFGRAEWDTSLARWDVDYVVASKDEWDSIPLFRRDPAWTVFYEDDDGVIFVPTT